MRRTLRKYRVPIIAALAVLALLFALFALTKGMVGDLTPGAELSHNKIEYGKEPSFSAGAWFSDVRYEYCGDGDAQWTSTVPTAMGKYKVRAVGQGLFGERYSDEFSFAIVQRGIVVTVLGSTVVYGESPRVEASLAFDDRIVCDEFVYDDITSTQTGCEPVKSAIKVVDKNGQDVTDCYIVTTKKESISFTKRDITVTVESQEKEYDGTALKHEVWQVTDGTLAFGDDVVKIVEGTFSTIIGAGSTENKGQLRVWKETAQGAIDITHHYNITVLAGELTITQKPVVVLPSGGEYIYDGEAHYETDFTIDPSTPLVGGHNISVRDYPVITDVGQIENLLIMQIQKADGSDVTDNYCFTYAGEYLLTVLPREISVTTQSGEVIYDGLDHTFEGVSVDSGFELPEGHTLKVTEATKIKNAEVLENKLVIAILDKNGNDVTKNFILNTTNGQIEVTKRDITITSGSLDGVYDGQAQGAQIVITGQGELAKGHSVTADFKNTVTESLVRVENIFTATILDENGEDVTPNYNVSYEFGYLYLEKRTITIVTDSAEKVYDGTELSANGFTYIAGSYEIANGQNAVFIGAPSQTDAGSTKNIFEIEIYEGTENKTSNYEIIYLSYGEITVFKREITVTADAYIKDHYDGEKITDLTYTIGGDGLANGQWESVEIYTEDTVNAGTWDYEITSVQVYTEGGENVTRNYEITREGSVIYIGKRPIVVTSNGFADKVYYDGERHTENTYTLSSVAGEPLAKGQYIKVSFLDNSYVEYATEDKENRFRVDGIFVNDTNENVTRNYTVTTRFGVLHLEKRPLHIVSGSIEPNTIPYDGHSHTENSYIDDTVVGMGLVSGHTISLNYLSSITDAGEVDNIVEVRRIRDRYFRNVIDNYEITYTYGKLRVYPRPITLTSQSATQVYNDVTLRNEDVLIGGMGTASGQEVVFSKFAYIKDAGSVTNTFSYEIRYIKSGEAVLPTNYDVTCEFTGELTVTKRPVIITLNSVSKVYDGLPLRPNGYTTPMYEDYLTRGEGILPYHTLKMTLTGEITKVGTTQIGVDLDTLDILDASTSKRNNYDVFVEKGYLEVTQREICLNGLTQTKEYDGTPLYPSFGNGDVGGLGLGFGDWIGLEFLGEQTNVGTSPSTILSYVIYNAQDEDVTFCYNIVEVTDGSLTVTPREITLSVLGGYKEYYDGGTLTSEGVTIDRLLTELGHTYIYTVTGEQTNVGTSYATLVDGTFAIFDAQGQDITYNYSYTVIDGELTVAKKRPITVTSGSLSTVYDGQMHNNPTYTIGGMGLADKRAEYEAVVFTLENAVNAGSYKNTFEIKIYTVEGDEDVTDNYEIKCEFGSIEIERVSVTVTTGSAEKEFDGTPLTNGEYTVDAPNLPNGYIVSANVTGTITQAGEKNNDCVVTIYDQDGKAAMLSNFEITKVSGKLTVKKLRIEVTTSSAEMVYNGTELRSNGYISNWEETEAYRKGLLNFTVSVSGRRTEIGRSKNTAMVGLYSNELGGENLATANCEVVLNLGTLTVWAPPLTLKSQSYSKEYTGLQAANGNVDIEGVIGYYHTLNVYFDTNIVSVGKYENVFTFEILDENGENAQEFYREITCEYGIIDIVPLKITISPISRKELYMGQTLYALSEILACADIERLNSENGGHTYTYTIDDMSDVFVNKAGQEMFFTIPSERFHLYLDGEALDMSNVNVISNKASLSLAVNTIQINVYKVTKAYTGKLIGYRADDWYLNEGQLPEGYRLEMILEGGRTEPGQVDLAEIMDGVLQKGNIHVYDENGNDVTGKYIFELVGTPLTVTQRAVQITAGSQEKYYDGDPLVNYDYSITVGSLANGHYISQISFTGEITEVGTAVSSIERDSIVIMDYQGNDVTSYYIIETVDGTLTVLDELQ